MEKKYLQYNSYNNCSECNKCNQKYIVRPFTNGVTPKSLADEMCGLNTSDCYSNQKRIIKTGKGPVYTEEQYILNSEIGPKFENNFYEDKITTKLVNQNKKEVHETEIHDKNVYVDYCDPRLQDNRTWDRIMLDSIPKSSEVNMSDVYDESLRNYGQNYTSYDSINSGQIQYYVSDQDSEANQRPNYVIESRNVNMIRQDPMGGLIPEYYREPLTERNRHISNYQHLRDGMKNVELVMDAAMYRRNKSDWGKLWGNTIKERHQRNMS